MGQLVFIPREVGGGGGGSVNSFRGAFTDPNLTAGVLTVTHSLGNSYVIAFVYDDNDVKIDPDSITNVDANNIDIDLTSFQLINGGAIPGTWNVVVLG